MSTPVEIFSKPEIASIGACPWGCLVLWSDRRLPARERIDAMRMGVRRFQLDLVDPRSGSSRPVASRLCEGSIISSDHGFLLFEHGPAKRLTLREPEAEAEAPRWTIEGLEQGSSQGESRTTFLAFRDDSLVRVEHATGEERPLREIPGCSSLAWNDDGYAWVDRDRVAFTARFGDPEAHRVDDLAEVDEVEVFNGALVARYQGLLHQILPATGSHPPSLHARNASAGSGFRTEVLRGSSVIYRSEPLVLQTALEHLRGCVGGLADVGLVVVLRTALKAETRQKDRLLVIDEVSPAKTKSLQGRRTKS